MLVCPTDLTFSILLAVCRRWRRIRNFRDQISSGCLRNSVDQYPEKWDLEEDVEAYAEAKENALAISEELALLLRREANP